MSQPPLPPHETGGKSPTDLSLVELLSEMARFDEAMRAVIAEAYAKKDRDEVFKLVGIWLHEGPGMKSQPKKKK